VLRQISSRAIGKLVVLEPLANVLTDRNAKKGLLDARSFFFFFRS
jgi:hypothetical protein